MSTPSTHPLAVVTGASHGIGLELARQFAAHGYDLIVAAEDDAIQQAAAELSNGVSVEPVQVDLARRDGVATLYDRIAAAGRPLDALALNAGVGQGGAFHEQNLDDALEIVDLNVRSTVELAGRVLPEMVARGEGRLLITSSIASTMPGSFQAVYNASKSFTQSFALALRDELKDTGVTVTALIPGPTDTEFFDRADMQDTKVGSGEKDDPAEVAREGFEGMINGEERVFAGSMKSKAQGKVSRLIPDSLKAGMHRSMAEPGSGSEE